MRRALALAGLLAVLGLGGLLWEERGPAPEITVSLPTQDGRSDLIWHCPGDDGAEAANARALAAHAAFQQGLDDITTRAAAAMQRAMDAANAAGEVPDTLPAIDDNAEAEAHALAQQLAERTGCRLEGF